jgi:hypothetical protein
MNTILSLLREIDDKNQVCWDTDADLEILSGFIESRKLQNEFAEYVQTIAEFDKSVCG